MAQSSILDAFAERRHIDGALMARIGGHWVPLTVDAESLEHALGGLAASGHPVRPLLPASQAAPNTPSLFRLELPCRGDLSRAFIRWHEPFMSADSALLNYKDAPFLFFIGNVLCVRKVPSWAIVPRAANVHSYGAWERLALCCESDECEGALEPPFPTSANLVLTFSLQSRGRRVSFDRGCFVRHWANGGTSPASTPVAFAFVETLPKGAAAEQQEQHRQHVSDATGAAAKVNADEPHAKSHRRSLNGTFALVALAVAIVVGLSRVATTGEAE